MKTVRRLFRLVLLAVRSLLLLGRVSRQSPARPRAMASMAAPPAVRTETATAVDAPGGEPIPIMPEAVWVGGRRIHLPPPSVWPAVLAFGVTVLMFGLITSVVFDAVGLLLIAWAVAGWIGEISHGHEE
jgi:hypothetical protein